jgi:hypothetical protein
MENQPASTPAPRNPITQQKHHQEVLWQITLPLVLGGGLILATAILTVWAGVGNRGDVSLWADISLIWLILPWLLVTLIFIAILAGLVYAFTMMISGLPPLAYRIQGGFRRASVLVRSYANRLVEPVLRVNSAQARVKAFKRSLGEAASPKRKRGNPNA